jgi:PBP1b-binding outer membrane lipoprotein LpoB
MKKLTGIMIAGVATAVLFSGCVPITYTKTVTVQKDAQGRIIGTTEIESITEPHSEMKKIEPVNQAIVFQNLK